MKIKLDENLPLSIALSLQNFGHDVHTVQGEGLTGSRDGAIWEAAQQESRFLITQDLDFSDLRRFLPGSHAGILLVRLRSASRHNLILCLERVFEKEPVEEWRGCFVVATERKIRVIKPD